MRLAVAAGSGGFLARFRRRRVAANGAMVVSLLAASMLAASVLVGGAWAGVPAAPTEDVAPITAPTEAPRLVTDYLAAKIGGTRLHVPVEYVHGWRGKTQQRTLDNVRLFLAWSEEEQRLVHASRDCGGNANNPARCPQLINVGIVEISGSLLDRATGYLNQIQDKEEFLLHGLAIYRKHEGETYRFPFIYPPSGELEVTGNCGCGRAPCRNPESDGARCSFEFLIDDMRVWFSLPAARISEWPAMKTRVEVLVRSFVQLGDRRP